MSDNKLDYQTGRCGRCGQYYYHEQWYKTDDLEVKDVCETCALELPRCSWCGIVALYDGIHFYADMERQGWQVDRENDVNHICPKCKDILSKSIQGKVCHARVK
jgi:hypothetical protein